MFNKEKIYTFKELLDSYSLYNLEFKFYGNNDIGDLELYLKTDSDKISVFKSLDRQTKYDFLNSDEDYKMNLKFQYDREVDDLELDIVAIVLRTSNMKIPAGRYTLKALEKLTKRADLKANNSNLSDGIIYMIVDNNTACSLYDNVYLFNEKNEGIIKNLEEQYKSENDSLLKNNLKIILDYYNNLINEN